MKNLERYVDERRIVKKYDHSMVDQENTEPTLMCMWVYYKILDTAVALYVSTDS